MSVTTRPGRGAGPLREIAERLGAKLIGDSIVLRGGTRIVYNRGTGRWEIHTPPMEFKLPGEVVEANGDAVFDYAIEVMRATAGITNAVTTAISEVRLAYRVAKYLNGEGEPVLPRRPGG